MSDDTIVDGEETQSETTESSTDSGESQTRTVEDNSHGEARKNKSNWEKLSKKAKQNERDKLRLESENKLLREQLGIKPSSTEESEEGDDEEDISKEEAPFTDPRSEIWFIRHPDAEQYREQMAELIEENPIYSKLSLDDFYALAKDKFPKSESRKSFDLGNGK